MPKGYIINLVVVVVVVVLVVPVLNQFQTTAAKAASSRQMARPSFALLLRLVFPSCHTFLVYGSVQNMHGKLAFAAPIPSRINPTNRVSPHHYHQLDNHTRAHAHTHTRTQAPRLGFNASVYLLFHHHFFPKCTAVSTNQGYLLPLNTKQFLGHDSTAGKKKKKPDMTLSRWVAEREGVTTKSNQAKQTGAKRGKRAEERGQKKQQVRATQRTTPLRLPISETERRGAEKCAAKEAGLDRPMAVA